MQLIPASLLWKSREKRIKNAKPDIDKRSRDKTDDTLEEKDREYTKFIESVDKYEDISKIDSDDTQDSVLIERQITAIDDLRERKKYQVQRDDDIETKLGKEETVFETLKQLAFNPSFVLFAIGMGVAYPALGILFIFIVDLFLDAGLTEEEASLGLLLIHMFSIFGRLVPGIIMQSGRISTLSVPIFAALVTSGAMVGLAFVQTLEINLFLCCLIGLPYGMFVSVFSVTSLKLVGIKRLSNAIGVLFTLNGLGSGLAGPVSGMYRRIITI
jgi:hypothetical protein